MGTQGNEFARLRAVAYGLVQGVGFRYYIHARARTLDVTGFVRNLPDGSVELVAEGQRPALEELLRAMQRGPLGARVTNVTAEWLPYTGQFQRFDIRG